MIILHYDYTWHDAVGNVGVVLFITSYWALQTGKISSKSLKYSVTNLIVAILLTINLYFRPNLSGLIIQFFWFIISIYGIFRAVYKPKPQIIKKSRQRFNNK